MIAGGPRRAHAALEPLVGMAFFDRRWRQVATGLGLDPMQAYVCARAAALGRVPGEVVASIFFSFPPDRVAAAADDGWAIVGPERVAAERDAVLARVLNELLADIDRQAAADAAASIREALQPLSASGRPMFAAHRRLPPAADRLLDLWRTANTWREYRGDGHHAASLMVDVDGAVATVLGSLWRGLDPGRRLRVTNHPAEALDQAMVELERRRWVAKSAITDEGRRVRQLIEEETDRLAEGPFHTGVDLGPTLNLLERCSAKVVAARETSRS